MDAPSWLNSDFAQKILHESENDKSIRVVDFFVKAGTQTGDNYSSDIFRGKVEFLRGQNDQSKTEKKSILFKLLPVMKGFRQDLILNSQIFDTEISMMTNTLKKMNEMVGYEYRFCANVLYIEKGDRPLLALEDLSTLGFRMADRQSGLDFEHSLLAIQEMARFHASSAALCEKDPSHKKLYVRGLFASEQIFKEFDFFRRTIISFAQRVAEWPELGPKYADKLMKMAEKVYDIGSECFKLRDGELGAIIHGDCWVNNMLFRYDKDNKPVQHIFVDFQLCYFTNVAVDIQYFLNTSVSVETMTDHKDELIQKYHCTLLDTMKRLDCKIAPPTLDVLLQSIKERQKYGMICSFSILPIVLIDKNVKIDFEELIKQEVMPHFAFDGKIFRQLIVKKLPEYDEQGLLDV